MADAEFDAREQALQYAARLRGLSLIRMGDTFALVDLKLSGATLDQIAAYLAADSGPDHHGHDDARRANLQTLLKAEHAMLAELEAEKRRASSPKADDRAATEAALAEIRRRIAELSEERSMGAQRGPARRP
jgi:hypothetical protein